MNKVSFLKRLIFPITLLLGVGALAGCGQKDPRAGFIYYASNGSCPLTIDYANHDFFVDGVGEVEVFTYIDGDTTHFKNVYGDTSTTIKIRYYGIDTPESTGAVQPYGKQASNFTKEHLENAAKNGTIVISSKPNKMEKPETDATGSRYLGLVWIHETKKHAPASELTLLNLYIVQEGLSWTSNVSNIPEFSETFQKAYTQAEKYKLKLHSGEDDPLFNYGGAQSVSLLDVKAEMKEYINDQTHVNKFNNARIRFTGVVSGYCDRTLYVQEYYPVDKDDPSKGGEWAGINIFCGMSPISSIYTEIGAYIEVVGLAQDSETFGFQVTDTAGHWPRTGSGDENDCKLLLTAAQNTGVHALKTFEYTTSQMNSVVSSKNTESLYCRVKVTESLVCSDAYVSPSSGEITLSFAGASFKAYLPFSYFGNPDDTSDIWNTEEHFIGKTFKLSGVYAYHKTTSGKLNFQIIPCSSDDLVCVTDHQGTTRNLPYSVTELATKAATYTTDSKIFYYAKGVVKSFTSNADVYNFVLTDGSTDVNVSNAILGNTVDKNNIAIGSTLLIQGNVNNKNGGTMLNATVFDAKPHGAIEEDPLNVEEASDIALGLQEGAATSTIYYIVGRIASIEAAYDPSTKRVDFTFEAVNSKTIVSTKVRLASDDFISSLVVGQLIMVRGKLWNNKGVANTYTNGTQIVKILDE